MQTFGECVVCGTLQCTVYRDPARALGRYECAQCGPYIIDDIAAGELRRLNLHKGFVSGSIRRMAGSETPRLSIKELERLAALPMPTFSERLEAYLLALSEKAPSLDEDVSYLAPPLVASAYCGSRREPEVIAGYLQDGEMLRPNEFGSGVARLLAKGRMRADELRSTRASSSQGFIAMWFNTEMEAARRDGLELGIRNAGYAPHRVDDKHHIDKIDDRIIADIRRSRFLVADLTGHRAGVYYEAGFAKGLEKPVFYTCRVDQKDDIHFDIRQFNCILWKNPAELAKLLQDRIEAVIGFGPQTAISD